MSQVLDLPIVANVMIKVNGQESIPVKFCWVMKWRIRDGGMSNPYQCYTQFHNYCMPSVLV